MVLPYKQNIQSNLVFISVEHHFVKFMKKSFAYFEK
jgi:hypothetical protein